MATHTNNSEIRLQEEQRKKDFAAALVAIKARQWAAELAAKVAISSEATEIDNYIKVATELTAFFYDFVAKEQIPATIPPSTEKATQTGTAAG